MLDLVARVERLERENRRLKIAGGVVVSALLAMPLIAAVMPQEVPDLIQAREFQVVDGNGVHVIMDSASIGFYDAEGTARSTLTPTAIEYRDDHFTLRASMGEALAVYDEKGQEIWRMPPR